MTVKMDIDHALARLGAVEAHPGLNGLEARVLDAVAARQAVRPGAGMTMAAMALALVLGAVSNVVPGTPAHAAPSLSPLGAPSVLAPSSLLLGVR